MKPCGADLCCRDVTFTCYLERYYTYYTKRLTGGMICIIKQVKQERTISVAANLERLCAESKVITDGLKKKFHEKK